MKGIVFLHKFLVFLSKLIVLVTYLMVRVYDFVQPADRIAETLDKSFLALAESTVNVDCDRLGV